METDEARQRHYSNPHFWHCICCAQTPLLGSAIPLAAACDRGPWLYAPEANAHLHIMMQLPNVISTAICSTGIHHTQQPGRDTHV